MDNVLYSKIIQHPAEEMGSEHASLYLTQEVNCYVVWLQVDTTTYLLQMFLQSQRNFAVEVAVRYGKRPLQELLTDALKVYP